MTQRLARLLRRIGFRFDEVDLISLVGREALLEAVRSAESAAMRLGHCLCFSDPDDKTFPASAPHEEL